MYVARAGQEPSVDQRNTGEIRTIGVEEELLLVDPDNGVPQAMSVDIIRYAHEHGEVPRGRRQVPDGVPDPMSGETLETEADAYALTADEQLTCGCHVHVSVTSPEEGVAVLDRIRPWLPPLLALSANSPFWHGHDTGYASWRQQVWGRWPSSGPTEPFESAKAYRATVEAMLGTGALLDEGMIYFDARLSRRYPTVEIRVADVCLNADDTVLIAALVRGLVDTASRAWQAGEPPDPIRTELLRLAMWRASRSGLRGELVHPVTRRAAPVTAVLSALRDHVAAALAHSGDLETVDELLHRVLKRGNGACAQRSVYMRNRDVTAVVSDAVHRTTAV
jgi:carboxylate-amine ligase